MNEGKKKQWKKTREIQEKWRINVSIIKKKENI